MVTFNSISNYFHLLKTELESGNLFKRICYRHVPADTDSNVHPQLVKPSAHWLCRHLYPGWHLQIMLVCHFILNICIEMFARRCFFGFSSQNLHDGFWPETSTINFHESISILPSLSRQKELQPFFHISHLEPLQAKGVLCSDRKCRQEKREETELSVGT